MNKKSRHPLKEYLIDITLRTLEISQPVQPPSKVLCEIHYDDNYLKLKLQPTVKNGVASFYEEKIRVPYSSEVALVFKMQRMRKEIFLGHHLIDAQKSLQDRVFHYNAREKLEEADAYIDFEVKIVDKHLFEDDLSDEFEEEELDTHSKSNYSEDKFLKKHFNAESAYKPRSLVDGNISGSRRSQTDAIPVTPEQFRKMLTEAEDIVDKYRVLAKKKAQKLYFKRDSKGSLKTEKIVEVEERLQKCEEEQRLNTTIFVFVVITVSFLLGFILA